MTLEIITSEANVQKSEQSGLKTVELISVLLVAGSGFFVDVYDVVLFSVLRVPSLTSLGIPKSEILSTGVFLLNMQLVGMIIGGFIWGILGDKKGRKASLFGSIFLYSAATLLNGFVNSLPIYALLRFLAGIGLAGEVGAALTIAAEVAPAKYRGYAISAVRVFGSAGGLLACVLGGRLPWRIAYISAGIAGFILLLARMSIKESNLFMRVLENKEAKLGSIKIFLNRARFFRLLRCIVVVVPFWFVFGILISFAPEICNLAKDGGGLVTVAAAGFYFSMGTIIGDILSSVTSQWLCSRKLAILIFAAAAMATVTILFLSQAKYYVFFCLPLGIFIAYHVVVNTTTAEQFGTNVRAMASTLTPNFGRASAILLTMLFSCLASIYGALNSAMIVGAICFTLAFTSLLFMEETFAKDLNFIEN